ncbi:hypothetical protein [Pseudoalteromonas pernae]|uniref:hypothetical protein n=1 Tax=Pseudoalteromonas pernae TaxID=3118054 RepID=UPI0032423555
MNISGGTLPAMSGSGQGAEIYSAALAKKRQQADGQAAIALIESAANVTRAAQSPSAGVTSTLGNNINIHV